MLTLTKVAVTGIPGSGKSTVCQVFREYGAFVVDTDEIVGDLLSLNTLVRQKVIDLFGPKILKKNQICKKKISKIVFSSLSKLKSLEAILYPLVREEVRSLFKSIKEKGLYRFFVVEVPLLFEAKMEDDFDIVIAVSAKKEIARHRFKKGWFAARCKNQLPSSAKASKADFVLINNGDIPTLRSSIQSIVSQLQECKEHK